MKMLKGISINKKLDHSLIDLEVVEFYSPKRAIVSFSNLIQINKIDIAINFN